MKDLQQYACFLRLAIFAACNEAMLVLKDVLLLCLIIVFLRNYFVIFYYSKIIVNHY